MVVLGHSIQYGSGVTFFSGECYFDDILFKIIYTFHMPCFGILSGYLYQQHVRNRTIAKKIQKIIKLIFPMLCFAIVNVMQSFLEGNILATFPAILQNYIWIVCFNWWFIWSIIICYIFSMLIESIRLQLFVKILFILCAQILFILLPNNGNMPLYGFIFLYFFIGYFLTDLFQLYSKWGGHIKKCVIVLMWVGCIFLYHREDYIYTSQLSLNGIFNNQLRQLNIDIFRWISGILGSFSFMDICNIFIGKLPQKIISFFCFLGKNTIYIYILQSYFSIYLLKVVKIERIPIHYLFNFLEAAFVIAICCIMICFFESIRIRVKKLLKKGE